MYKNYVSQNLRRTDVMRHRTSNIYLLILLRRQKRRRSLTTYWSRSSNARQNNIKKWRIHNDHFLACRIRSEQATHPVPSTVLYSNIEVFFLENRSFSRKEYHETFTVSHSPTSKPILTSSGILAYGDEPRSSFVWISSDGLLPISDLMSCW